jgi:hypothetical protein
MEVIMKVDLKIIRVMGMVSVIIKMETIMKDSGKMIRESAEVNLYVLMDVFSKGSLLKIKLTEVAIFKTQMEIYFLLYKE